MHLSGLTELLRQDAHYRSALRDLQAPDAVRGLNVIRAARAYVLATLAHDWNGPILYLTARGKRAYNIVEQLPVWLEDERTIHRFAEQTPMFYDRLPWDRTVIRERLEALQAILTTPPNAPQPIVVASTRALMQRTIPVHIFREQLQTLRVGSTYRMQPLLESWLALGYEPVTMVAEPGTFSRRGGILDLYPAAANAPVRLEFFGDELETLREFDPATQRTVDTVQEVLVAPAREALPSRMPPVAGRFVDWFDSFTGGEDDSLSSIAQDRDALANGQSFPLLEHYLPYIYDEAATILDYLGENALLLIEDPDDVAQMVQQLAQEAEETRENNIKTHQLPPDALPPYVDWPTLDERLQAARRLEIGSLNNVEGARLFRPGERFGGQLRPTLTHIRERHRAGERVVVISQQLQRLENLWYEQDSSEYLPKTRSVRETLDPGELRFVEGQLSEGFSLQSREQTLHVITDAEIFGWSRPEPRRRKSSRKSAGRLPESDYSDWKAGDYVVHIDYGIGQFKGMRSRTIEGNEREYLLIEYDGTDILFVPIHQADRLTRYVGPDEAPPKLNTLGKQDIWTKAKEKARKAAQEEAKELLQIYAKRAKSRGYMFKPDTEWQLELEASFPYVETEDQLRVLREIKNDMESSMPMDRLVCGDVGYGKTELALRAAFKAINDGKQVAILVPTTVLADQHYKTFSHRMEPFPVRVEMLSRFRTKGEQNETVDKIASGEVDIIIGTHRILSKDVKLKDLGLIIIDEEQRFGVKHKEHFKKYRAHVDVLTLTATPIPRTLYMGLSGVRDISMLQTPPEDRLPVITHVGTFDSRLVRQAVLREIDRGGQVFVIHNRVKSIQQLREKLENIVPEANIVTAHGQMSGNELETVIAEFGKGEHDILLATSIIENGIDMPNVNTLIVDRADWFGMAQLYQIRGRVGRGATQAYSYFFHDGPKTLTDDARQRLEALAELTDLGSGFQVSMRDLELRGAGDILSTNQTGHVATVGLQLYTQLLQQAVANLKDEMKIKEPLGDEEITIDLPPSDERIIIDVPVPAYIPEDWIPEMALRLQLYRRIGTLRTVEALDAMQTELRDRFGTLPKAVEGLMFQIRVKILALDINASGIVKPREHLLIKLPWLVAVDRDRLQRRLKYGAQADVDVSRTAVEVPVRKGDAAGVWKQQLLDVLKELKRGLPEQAKLEGQTS